MKINCVNKKCVFNVDETCKREIVTIVGLFAQSKIETLCASFMNKNNPGCSLDYEAKNNIVKCDADTCKYHQNGYCTKDVLQISGYHNAKYRSETECDNFELKERKKV